MVVYFHQSITSRNHTTRSAINAKQENQSQHTQEPPTRETTRKNAGPGAHLAFAPNANGTAGTTGDATYQAVCAEGLSMPAKGTEAALWSAATLDYTM